MAHVPVEIVAKLSALTFVPSELSDLSKKLDETTAYVSNLHELETTATEPTSSPHGSKNVTFEDGTSSSRTIPPGTYKVPRIM